MIAARLTESERHEVTLVEAGPDYPSASEHPHTLPEDLQNGLHNSMHAHDWNYLYYATFGDLASRVPMEFPRGRVVGGSSAVNTCIALRGQPEDYDEWAALGLPEWSWRECLPAFKRLERDLDFPDSEATPWHGSDGPLPIRRHTADELVPWQAAFLEACAELGFAPCPDTNAPHALGAGAHAMNKIAGKRVSAAHAYLTPAVRARSNLRILPQTLVRRVLFANKRAVGVEVERFGRVGQLHADRVVLAAGAIATPGILLRSGIGSDDDLARIGVSRVARVPGVARRLLDHPGVAIFFWPKARGFSQITHPLVQTVCRYTATGSDVPCDMQLQPGSWVPLPRAPVPLVTLASCLGKPRGQGTLVFESARVHDAPIIRTALLHDAADAERMHEALRWIARLARTRAISQVATPIYPRRAPFDASDRLRVPITRITGSGYHPCGTAPMGPDSDPYAVTDARGRVRHVAALYVADVSLTPTIPTANTNLTALMMGERFGAWLQSD